MCVCVCLYLLKLHNMTLFVISDNCDKTCFRHVIKYYIINNKEKCQYKLESKMLSNVNEIIILIQYTKRFDS